MRTSVIAVVAACIFEAGCISSSARPPHAVKDGLLDIYVTDNDQKLLFVKNAVPGENHRTCLTPPHDSVSGKNGGVGLSGGVPAVPALREGVTFERGTSELSLGGRSPSALISRELMYRACELTLNMNSDLETSLKIYERFLQAVEKVAASQTESGSAPLSLAAAPLTLIANPAGTDAAAASNASSEEPEGDGKIDAQPPAPDPGTIDTEKLD